MSEKIRLGRITNNESFSGTYRMWVPFILGETESKMYHIISYHYAIWRRVSMMVLSAIENPPIETKNTVTFSITDLIPDGVGLSVLKSFSFSCLKIVLTKSKIALSLKIK